MTIDSPLQAVLQAAGGPARLAKALGIVQSAVSNWKKVPARHIPRIEAMTGITGPEMRPDLYADPLPVPPTGETGAPIPRGRYRKPK